MEQFSGSDFWSFRRMITPVIIVILFWLGVIGTVIGGIVMIIGGATQDSAEPMIILIIMGLAYVILGPIFVRVYCEILIVIFRINETLTDMRDLLRRRPLEGPPPSQAPSEY